MTKGADGYTDHERWLRAIAPLIVAHEASDDGDSTAESVVARYADKPVIATMDAEDAVRWAVATLASRACYVDELRATIEALNDARATGSLRSS